MFILDLIGGLLGGAVNAWIWAKTLSTALQFGLILVGLAALSALVWLASRKPIPAIILALMLFAGFVYIDISNKPTKPIKEAITQNYEVSSKWKTVNGWDRYWINNNLPKEYKKNEAIIRIRIDKQDIFVVMKEGIVYVKGIKVKVLAVEPITGGN